MRVSLHPRDPDSVWVMEFDAKTALIVVDVQNDFADPQGSLYVPGGEQAIEFINDQIRAAVEGGAVLTYTRDWHPESTPHFQKEGGPWPVHCVAGTNGAEFYPDLDVRDDAIQIKKGTGGEDGYSGFHIRDPRTGEESPTGLEEELRRANVEKVAIVGLALDYCVKETAADAARLGFETTLLADGTRAVNLRPGDGSRTVAHLVDAGVRVE